MDWVASQRREIADEGGRRVLARQLRLLKVKRAEVETPRPAGAGPEDGLANDLAGIRFVLRAALLSQGLTDGNPALISGTCAN